MKPLRVVVDEGVGENSARKLNGPRPIGNFDKALAQQSHQI